MNYFEALAALLEGKFIARPGWKQPKLFLQKRGTKLYDSQGCERYVGIGSQRSDDWYIYKGDTK